MQMLVLCPCDGSSSSALIISAAIDKGGPVSQRVRASFLTCPCAVSAVLAPYLIDIRPLTNVPRFPLL